MPKSPVEIALARWRSNLIDLSRRNPLLLLRPTKRSYLEITRPGAGEVFDRVVKMGKTWSFCLPPEERNGAAAPAPKSHELVAAGVDRPQLLEILTNLYRRAHTDYLERGLHILHLAFGVLEWSDPDAEEHLRSPLVLLPVELARKTLREPFHLAGIDEDPFLNPALVTRFGQDFKFRLPDLPDDWDETTLSACFQEIESAISGLPGWRLQPTTVLTLFSFFKGVMYQDLEENADKVKAHPLVSALAGEKLTTRAADVPDEKDLDDKQDPQRTFHILDADGSQRQCLEAAAAGQSFVLQGPPGTGKSQTIANLIADFLARGKKVLFVSEKMAALEVVYNRLRHVGLGDFCLELHSHKANKREVVTELARCFQEGAKVPAEQLTAEFERYSQRRAYLNNYVKALHTVREPLRRSVWSVLEELSQWEELPTLALGMTLFSSESGNVDAPVVSEVNATWLEEAKQAVQRFRQLGHIAQEEDHPWRGFKAERFTLQLRDEVLGLVDRVRSRLDRLLSTAAHYADQLGVQGPVAWLLKLGDLLEARPALLPAAWLQGDLDALAKDLEQCADQYLQLAQARAPLTAKYGAALWSVPEGTAAGVDKAWQAAAPLLARGDEAGIGLLKQQQQLRGWAADTQRRIPSWLSEARTLEKWLAVALPRGAGAVPATAGTDFREDPSVHGLRQLLRLAHLCMADNAPERTWVHDPKALEEARSIITDSRPAFTHYHQTRARLLQTYTERFFELDLVRLAESFAGPYQSFWRRLFSGQYRRDRRAIARRSRSEAMPATIWEDVAVARDLMTEKARLEADQPQRQAVLGRYEKGLDTDVEAADRATRVAAEAVELVHALGCEALPARLVDALCAGMPAPEKVRAAAKRLQDSLASWLHATQELKSSLPMDALPATDEPLEESALSALNQYAKDLQAALNTFGSLTDPVLASAPQRPPDTAALVADLRLAEALRVDEAKRQTEGPRWQARLGPGFQGVATDWDAMRKALSWARRLREFFPGAAPPESFIRLVTSPSVKVPAAQSLRQALEQFENGLHSVENRFEPPGPSWQGKLVGEQPPEALPPYLTTLRDRISALGDWIDYRHLLERFDRLGLIVFWTALQERSLPREQAINLFLKAFYASWLEAVFRQDPVLGEFRRPQHEEALAEFRELDRRLIQLAAQRVAQLAQQKRPKAEGADADLADEIALLMKEAHKKARHLPLRRLFEQVPRLLPRLKPCLLMSPLSVSHFLNPDKIAFDIVIFDEASQICPEDAVVALYRGKQCIITGDDQQLPPTSFFQQNAGEEDEETPEEEPAIFESILEASRGAGLPQRLLRWHYRSRHEGLITFSNRQFYDNRLVTFPSPFAENPALGVKFHYVADGVYDRGGRRDNPREAEVVTELVFEHIRAHSDKTLGVIAFSQAQMLAIEDEIERRLQRHPELENYFKSGRLEGFFVKNLETVQGDERDVILFSVGYGQDPAGKLLLNFGPLNREGGQRRLNVAATRAREKVVVVSSLRARDLNLDAGHAAGAILLRNYLDYAERGPAALAEGPGQAATELTAAGIAKDLIAELRRHGYDASPQFGWSAVRIDVAVHDPDQPGRLLVGIELDGPNYQAAATARDRDRLRPEVLQRLGWHLHRIWSPDWLYRRKDEITRLLGALEEARLARVSESAPPAAPGRSTEPLHKPHLHRADKQPSKK
jgi:hypothetical protein